MSGLRTFAAAWPLFADAVVAGAVAGGLLGALGTFLLLGRMVFLSATLAQVASLGVTAGLVVRGRLGAADAAPAQGALGAVLRDAAAPLGAWVATTLAATLLALQARFAAAKLEATLGLLFAAGGAGTLLLACDPAAELHDVQALLFGSAVAVPPAARRWLCALAFLLLAPTALALPALGEAWTDPQGAWVRGVPVRTLRGWVLLALSVSVAACTQVLGALPVFALSVAPALFAVATCRTLAGSFFVAGATGALAGAGGYVAAYLGDWPVGATQAAVAVAVATLGRCLPARNGA